MERALRKYLPGGVFTNVSNTHFKAMVAVHGHGNKTTERWLRLVHVRAGVRGWSVRPKGLRGNLDFVFPVAHIVVFGSGCPKRGQFNSKQKASKHSLMTNSQGFLSLQNLV